MAASVDIPPAESEQMKLDSNILSKILDSSVQRETSREVSAAASSATLFQSSPPSPSEKQNEGKKEIKPRK